MKKINAISFTPKYDELEDRIRISINYDDIQNRVDFMMTRAFVLKLFPVLDEYLVKFYTIDLNNQAPKTVEDESVKNKKVQDTSTTVTDGTNLELHKQEDELLLELKFSYEKNTKMSIIEFISQKTRASVRLDAESLEHIFSIIKNSIPFFSWGISPSL